MARLRKFYVKSGNLQCILLAPNSFYAAIRAFDEHMFDGCVLDPYFVYVNECGFDSIESDIGPDAEVTDWWQVDSILESLGYPIGGDDE